MPPMRGSGRTRAPWEATLEERRAWDVTLQDGLVVSESRARYATRPEAKRKRRKP